MPTSQPNLRRIDKALTSRSERTRWQAAIKLGDFAASAPDLIWPLVIKHGSRRHADARMAIATCVLEHILEHHFSKFFPMVAAEAIENRWFADTVQSCWQMGQGTLPENAKQWKRLMKQLQK